VSNPATAVHFTQQSFHKSDVHLTYFAPDDRAEVQVFVRNIEDRNSVTAYQRGNARDMVYLAEPRLFGVRGTYRF
jgi:hypothetical protein